ncbi:MAG TPA: bifunctional diaminohydroxyphosphoribosylaminopyrimidine deaminase/5-amino-6-(5-phosphoribosylamino)uracil reductase RibD [Pseudomonadales bacterium]
MFSASDTQYMALALQSAEKGLYTTQPNPRVGCVLVKDGRIIGQGWHEQAGAGHAEINALRDAAGGNADISGVAKGATAYVTLEPCSHHGKTPPCCEALLAAGVTKVVAAMEDPNPLVSGKGLALLKQHGVTTKCGLLEAEARALNPGFISRMTTKRPFVRSKMAISLDGRTAMASGESKWITGPAARADVQRWRARSDAIVMGVDTVLADNPSMTVRLEDWSGDKPASWQTNADIKQPIRVVLDSKLRLPKDAKMLGLPGETWVFTAETPAHAQCKILQAAGAKVISMPVKDQTLDLAAVLTVLAQAEINEVLVESGATLSGAFVQAGLLDEQIIYLAAKLMGNQARPLYNLPGVERMEQSLALDIKDIRQVGDDIRLLLTSSPKRL